MIQLLKKHQFKLFVVILLFVGLSLLTAFSDKPSSDTVEISLLDNRIQNTKAAYIPSQCYTKTRGQNDRIHNPCFSCHTNPKTPNFIDDSELQLSYDFRDTARKNPWTNLFKDRTAAVEKISDEEIMRYVRQSNYFDEHGDIRLTKKLQQVPEAWDVNKDGKWNGYQPDCYYNFDQEGFDRDPSGKDTGWRAFGYTPFLGTFWPTNGSTDDVLIRLNESFRQNEAGQYDRAVYKLNLAIVEALIQNKDVTIPPTDEKVYGVDLDHNGKFNIATQVVFKWDPRNGINMSYVGKAKQLLDAKQTQLAAGLYPVGTEFLHTVRYIDMDDKDQIQLAARIKELRYGVKINWNNYSQLRNASMSETKEIHDFPERLRRIVGNPEAGMLNGVGWAYQAFIEDKTGELRPQSYEESVNCMGCHSGLGVTTDSSFAFPRKLSADNFQAGWYYWNQKGIQGLKEPQWKDGTWEYTQYLTQNQSANEFRNNDEVIAKFFKEDGSLKQDEADKIHQDISVLLSPSRERAMMLNKAYKVIVDEQSYIYGRDAHVKPITTSWDIVPAGETTGVESPVLRP
ncbi:hypothetical protein QCB45_06060 [Thiomicrorhabdus sp. ZW0627]|uniref:hypothetical protein n=1 Tax=Thiomicrorhabdus sp. ZW0627 TaxID=3039774 RepID=UPI002436CF88|nr:hypothetical protein [Thiomicrorhabdus sp. ZW0627]MDG6773889.1 hypothetical protein [Thiomicrorhabdus sp. ZW0627]